MTPRGWRGGRPLRAAAPPGGRARRTLFLEVSDAAEMASALTELEGVAESVQLEIDGSRVLATVFPSAPLPGMPHPSPTSASS